MKKDLLDQSITLADLVNLITDKKSVKSMELNALLSLYLKLREYDIREETLSCYSDHLKYLIEFFNSNKVFESKDITQEIIDKYVKYCIKKGNKPITINKRIAILKTMLNYMSEKGFITLPDFNYKKLKVIKPKIDMIDRKDIQKIISHLNEFPLKHQLVFLLLLCTGIRRNELAHIRVGNINFKERIIYLEYTKSGVPRQCYFNDLIGELMKKVIANNSNKVWLFATGNTHISNVRVSGILLEIKNKLKIDVLSSHKLRHLYATELLNNGANIMVVKELLGHADLEMTKIYLDYTDKQIQKKNDEFNPINNYDVSNVDKPIPLSKNNKKA